MFGWGSSLGAPSVGFEVDKERNPPPRPTPLDFPRYADLETCTVDFDAIYRQLMAVKKPQDITADYIAAFNLQIVCDIPASEIIPEELLKHLPPLPWQRSQAAEPEEPPTLMANGSPYPAPDKYDLVKSELLFDNDDGFREVARMAPKPGRQRVKLTQSRKFWVGLERMAQYWDASLDNYYEKPVKCEISNGHLPTDEMQTDERTDDEGTTKMDIDSPARDRQSSESVYTGRRIGSGQEMPEDIREDTLRGLIEMVAWPFGCQASIPSLPPRLSVRNLLFPVRQNLFAGRAPQDRQTARKGILEGPLLVVQCRPETSFRDAAEPSGYGQRELCDLFREIGAMLLAAQERAREGAVEVKPGEGKWWTTIPRWGGAPNDGVTGEGQNADNKSETDGSNMHKRSRYGNPLLSSRRAGSGHPRKMSTNERWKILQAGPSLWDRRTKYMQIGKMTDSPFDDIFMVSSINHHVSILHLRVHRRYLDLLTSGESDCKDTDTNTDPNQPWQVLSQRRTKWYDLMNAEERIEALEGVWRVFHYLMRNNPD